MDFCCPQCGGPHFGSFEADGVRIYVCHGFEAYGHQRGWPPCGWRGPAEECFAEKGAG